MTLKTFSFQSKVTAKLRVFGESKTMTKLNLFPVHSCTVYLGKTQVYELPKNCVVIQWKENISQTRKWKRSGLTCQGPASATRPQIHPLLAPEPWFGSARDTQSLSELCRRSARLQLRHSCRPSRPQHTDWPELNGASEQSRRCFTLVTLTRPCPHPQTNFPAASDLSHHHKLSPLSRLLDEASFHHLACPAHTDAGFRALAGEAPASQSCQPSLNPQNTLF